MENKKCSKPPTRPQLAHRYRYPTTSLAATHSQVAEEHCPERLGRNGWHDSCKLWACRSRWTSEVCQLWLFGFLPIYIDCWESPMKVTGSLEVAGINHGLSSQVTRWDVSSWKSEETTRAPCERLDTGHYSLPSGNWTVCYWTWLEIVDLPIKNGDFPVRFFVNVYQRVHLITQDLATAKWIGYPKLM